jgi:hypothetical protein
MAQVELTVIEQSGVEVTVLDAPGAQVAIGPTLSTATPEPVGLTGAAGTSTDAAKADHVHAHGNQTGTSLHALATTSGAGFMSAAQFDLLDGATDQDSADTLVLRDASGDFEANNIYADLVGNAATATALATARTINGESFDGTNNITITAAPTAGSVVDASVDAAAAIALTKLATGALPTAITVASANLVDGTIVDADINASAAIALTKLATVTAGRVVMGNASNVATATELTGDLTLASNGVVTLSNSGVSAATVNDSATSVTPITIDAKGRITGTGSAVTITPSFNSLTDVPTTLAGYGITDAVDSSDVRLTDERVPTDDSVTDAKVSASAAIALTKLASITAGRVLLGNASNVPTATEVTGDVTINSTGVTAIGSGVIVNADVSASAAIAGSKIAPDFGAQNVLTTGTITGANLNVTGTAAPTTGSFRPATNVLAFATNTLERARLSPGGALLVGATTEPAGITSGTVLAASKIIIGSASHGISQEYAADITTSLNATTGKTVFNFRATDGTQRRSVLIRLTITHFCGSNTETDFPAAQYIFRVVNNDTGTASIAGLVTVMEYQYDRDTHFAFTNIGNGEFTIALTNPKNVAMVGTQYNVKILVGSGVWRLNSVTITA